MGRINGGFLLNKKKMKDLFIKHIYRVVMITVYFITSLNFFYMWYYIPPTLEITTMVKWVCFTVGILFALLIIGVLIEIYMLKEESK